MYDRKIALQNEMWIGEKNGWFDLWDHNTLVQEKCENYSYVVQKLVVVKKEGRLFVYSMEKQDKTTKIAEVLELSGQCSIRVEFHDYLYVIDSSCQISYTYKRKND